jgi:hypothetical protein
MDWMPVCVTLFRCELDKIQCLAAVAICRVTVKVIVVPVLYLPEQGCSAIQPVAPFIGEERRLCHWSSALRFFHAYSDGIAL